MKLQIVLLLIEQGRIELLIEQLDQARNSLRQALDLVDQHDFDEPAAGYYQQAVENDSPGSIQAGNRAMLAYCQIFMLEIEQAARNTAASIREAERFYDLRGEALARNIECIRLIESGEYPAAIRQGEKALALAEKLGATRFILDNLTQLAHATIRLGDVDRARQMLDKAWLLCRQDLQGFMGASVAAYMAWTCVDDEQQAWLEKGERLLTADALSHNHLVFYRMAIELSLAKDDTEQARYHTERLRRYTEQEPLPWADAAIRRVSL